MKKRDDRLLQVFFFGIASFMVFGLFVTGHTALRMGTPTGFAVGDPGVTRTFSPATVAPGGTVTVTLAVTLQGQFVWAIEETIPAGFTVTDSGTPSGATSNPNVLKWISYSSTSTPLSSSTITYKVKAPSTAGTYTFSGNYLFDTMTAATKIGGTSALSVQAQQLPSAEICDGKDNDLDGFTDEGFNAEQCDKVCLANGYVWTGFGAIDPKLNCCGNDPLEDSPYANEYAGAPLSLCDGRDNDCSGTIDEGYTTEECAQTCLNNGGEDYDPSRPTGRKCCGDHYASPFYEGNPYEETEHSCSDKQDNDCDGLIDKADPNCADCLTAADCGKDNNLCNGIEACVAGTCQVTGVPTINDNIDCTIDSCDPATGAVTHVPNHASCLDGKWCNGQESCSLTSGCILGERPSCSDTMTCSYDYCDEGTDLSDNAGSCKHDTSGCQCTGPSQCDDSNPCTTDSCDAGKCVHAPATGASCDDGFYCTIDDRCVNGACMGSARGVDDSIPCTSDSCDESKDIIVHLPDSSTCQDGLFCNGQEVCDAAVGCKAGTPVTVTDNIDCTEDSCDEANDKVVHIPVDQRCQDMKWCNGQEVCKVGTGCVPGSSILCTDPFACSVDYCSEGTHFYDNIGQCLSDYSSCPCTTDADCDDKNPCTDDRCGATKSCVNTPDDTNPCNDGKWCAVNDRCLQGACVSDPRPVDDSVSCTEDYCDETAQKVIHTPRNDICDDRLFCNGVETCQASGCVPGTPPKTDDSISCTVDACDEANDLIMHTPLDSLCLDGKWCNGHETCDQKKGCQAGIPPNCDDSLTCSIDTCSELTVTDDNIGECRFSMSDCSCSADSDCDDSNPCTTDSCSPDRACTHTMADGAVCDDGQWCTASDTCSQGACVGQKRDFSDTNSCTKDYCDDKKDEIVHIADDALCDDGKWCNGKETCSAVSGCLAGTSPSCDDTFTCTTDACSELLNLCVNIPIDKDKDSFNLCEGLSRDCDDSKSSVRPDAIEDCANGIDDDCDGLVDLNDPECFSCEPGAFRYCPKQEGPCVGTIENCTAAGRWPGCDAATYLSWNSSYQESETNLTDGIDNDCDGIVLNVSGTTNATNQSADIYANISVNSTAMNASSRCLELWVTQDWGGCDDLGMRHREVFDKNSCNTTFSKPIDTEICQVVASCYDGLMNGDESGVDCGGSCETVCDLSKSGILGADSGLAMEAEPIVGGILEELTYKITLSNDGEREIARFMISPDKWSKGLEVQSLLPGEEKTVSIKMTLPEQPYSGSVTFRALKEGSILAELGVSAKVTVPSLDMRIAGNGETGEVFLTIIADNTNKQGRTLQVSTAIHKGKETYYFDTSTHQLAPNKVYFRTDRLTGFSIKKGEYEVESVFTESGEELTSKSTKLSISSGEEAFNASLIFYLFLIAIICVTGYVIYTVYQKR